MATRHETLAAHLISRNHNIVNKSCDDLSNRLQDIVPGRASSSLTLKEQKDQATNDIERIYFFKTQVVDFVTVRDYVDIDKACVELAGLTASSILETLLGMDAEVKSIEPGVASSIDKEALEELNDYFVLVVPLIKEVSYPREVFVNNSMNDLLDCASYVCHGVDPRFGTLLSLNVKDSKEVILRHINTSRAYDGEFFSTQSLGTIRDYVESQVKLAINADDLKNIGDYIDSNVVKLPTMFRNWVG